MTLWNRGIDGSGNWLWQAGAPTQWVLWGRSDTPVDETMPDENNLPRSRVNQCQRMDQSGVYTLPPNHRDCLQPAHNKS